MTRRDHDDRGHHEGDDNDAPRDARLLAALRHAPDRDAAPPPEVTARILAAAREAVRPAPLPSLSWVQRLAAWLQAPQLGAAFGTIVVAVLVGVMWSTREVPGAFEPGATAAAPKPFESAASEGEATKPSADAALGAEPLQERPAATEALRDAAPADLAKARRNTAPAPAPATAPTPAAAKAKGERQAADAARTESLARGVDAALAASPPPLAVAPPPAAPTAQAPVQSREADAAAAATASPQPAPAAVAAPAKEQGAAASAAPQARLRADELKALLEQRAEAGAASASAAAPIAGRLAAKADSSIALDPLPRIEALLNNADAPSRAAWHSAGVPARAHGSAQQAWWRELRAATQGRWQRATVAEPTDAPWLMLTQDGRARARWWLDGEHLLLADAEGRLWRAPLSESQRRAWQQAVALW